MPLSLILNVMAQLYLDLPLPAISLIAVLHFCSTKEREFLLPFKEMD